MVGYNITIQLINYVDALAVWGLRPHAPPLTMSVVLTGNKFQTSKESPATRDRLGPSKIPHCGGGPGFGLPLKGAVLVEAVQVESV